MLRRPGDLWCLSDEEFFLQGACHVLTHVFLATHPELGFHAKLIRPLTYPRGFHVFASDGVLAFEARGFVPETELVARHHEHYRRIYPDWCGELVRIEQSCVSSAFCDAYRHRRLDAFAGDAIARAESFLASRLGFSLDRLLGWREST